MMSHDFLNNQNSKQAHKELLIVKIKKKNRPFSAEETYFSNINSILLDTT